MPQIINPFRPQNTPLAQAITQFGNDVYGDQLTPAIKREQLIAAQRENVETDALAQSFADPAGKLDYQAGILSGYKPQDMADMRRLQMADTFGARDQRTQNAQIGAGSPFTATAEAFDTNVATDRRGQDIASSDRRYGFNLNDATERYKFANTPEEVFVNGQAGFLPREKVFSEGVQPILSQSELGPAAEFNQFYDFATKNFPDRGPDWAKSYALQQVSKGQGQKITIGPDGTTIESGGLYGEPTNSVTSGAQESLAGIDAFDSSIERAKDMATRSPDAFGALGTVKGVVQDVNAIAQNIGLVAGGSDVNTELAKAQAFFASSGVSPEVFGAYNPDISNIDALSRLMVYQAAQALTQQTGRSVSDADVKNMTMIVGDPKSLTMNPDKFVNRMDMLQEFIDTLADQKRAQLGLPPIAGERNARRAERNAKRAAPGAPAPGGAVTVNSEQEALSQPPGTIVILNGRRFKVEE
jgi:hypothetical protein